MAMRFSILTLGDNYAELRSHEQFYREVIEEAEYAEDIDIFHLASELIVDTITPFDSLRSELIARYAVYQTKEARFSECRNAIYPV